MNYIFARNINNTTETGIVDVDTLTIICLCTEANSEILLQALNNHSETPTTSTALSMLNQIDKMIDDAVEKGKEEDIIDIIKTMKNIADDNWIFVCN